MALENRRLLKDVEMEIRKESEADSEIDLQGLMSFEMYVSKPFQRIMKYRLLFENMEKQTIKLAKLGLEEKPDEIMNHLKDLVEITKRIPTKVNNSLNVDRIQFPRPHNVEDEAEEAKSRRARKNTWGVVYDMQPIQCSVKGKAPDAVLSYFEETKTRKEDVKKWKKLVRSLYYLYPRMGLIAQRAIVVCEKKRNENAPTKFDFDILSNHRLQYRSLKDVPNNDDWHIVITWEPPTTEKNPPSYVALIKVASKDHFDVWIEQLRRIQSEMEAMGLTLTQPMGSGPNMLSVQNNLLFGSTISLRRRSSAEGNRYHQRRPSTSGDILEEKERKGVFDYDVGILYNQESLPTAMSLLHSLQKEGHRAYADITADRWNGTPDLNRCAFHLSESEHLVAFVNKSLSENLFFKTELLFAAKTDKQVFLFKSDQEPLPGWIENLGNNVENVHIPEDVVLSQPSDVTAHAGRILRDFHLKTYPRSEPPPPPRMWTEQAALDWLRANNLAELSPIFKTGAEIHQMARELRQSPVTMGKWLTSAVEEICGEKAGQIVADFRTALRSLYPAMDQD